jgi:hypothetical protein
MLKLIRIELIKTNFEVLHKLYNICFVDLKNK